MGVQYNTIENVPVASFETSWKNESANQPIKSVVAEITPSQSFNGYEYPWPGGGGKNLFNKADTAKQIDGASFSNGVITTAYSTGRLVAYIDCKPNTTYTVSRKRVSDNERFQVGYTTSQPANEVAVYEVIAAANSGTIGNLMSLTLTTGPNAAFLVVWAYWGGQITALDTLQIEYGTSASLFAPYSNICPISGHTEATVTHCGENVYSLTENPIEQGAIAAANGQNTNTNARIRVRSRNYTAVEGGRQYKIYTTGTVKDVVVNEYGENNAFLGASDWIALPATFTMQANTKSIRLLFRIDNTTNVYPADVTILVVTPNSGTTYPVSWQTEAGTVYGGIVDVMSGQLTVTHTSVTFDGSESWTWSESYGGQSHVGLSGMKSGSWYSDNNAKCNSFQKVSGLNDYGIIIGYNNNRVYFQHMGDHLPSVTDKTSWQNWLSNNNVTITYPLATPLTYNLTPTAAINTLLGVNNVWGDSGNIKKLMWQYTIFDILRVFINGFEITDFIAFGGWQRDRNDVDGPEAGRTLDARMHRARVATKMRYNVTCRPLLVEELSSLERLIMPEYVTVKVIGDPFYGTWEKTCYVNNTSAKYLIRKRNGAQWWSGITFPIIEV